MGLDDMLNEVIKEVVKDIDYYDELVKLEEHLQEYALYIIHKIESSN